VAGLDRIGISLWTMQSSAFRPGNWASLYRRCAEDARVVEELGFHGIWVGEHRVWYDGWCPAPWHALAYIAGRTSRIHLGTAMYLVPQHDASAAAGTIATVDELSGGRVEIGAGLGYRDTEYDALGLRRDRRGKMMDANLDEMEAIWAGERGDEPPVKRDAPPIWIGGLGPPSIARAARRGYGLLLPQTLRPHEYERVVTAYREQATRPATIGTIRELWITDDPDAAARHKERVGLHMTEEVGSWFALKDSFGFAAAEQVERQVGRSLESVAAGTPEQVAEALRVVLDAGVEYLALRLVFEFVESARLHEQLHRLAEEVVPLLEGAGVMA
jgi:alkanesulfonate monooxygenase SsuD/methylene tetrahydromethanopterin reductase-like flavin-dependent oxidoreductase (luciferase family)